MSVDIQLSGIDEIINKLNTLGRKAKEVEERALTKGGDVILNQAKNNFDAVAKTRTGNLKQLLSISKAKGVTGRRYVLVGFEKDDDSEIFYAKFIEWGAVPHKIKIKRGKYAGRIINHPGISSKPFLGPAYESKKEEAKNIIVNEFKKELGL